MRYLRRIIWYFASRLLLICVLLGLAITVFYYAMNLTNIQIVLKDGMATRAKVIMGISDNRDELRKYFQNAALSNDAELKALSLGNSPYADYNVRGLDHRLEVGFFWIWPWDSSVRVNVTESVPRIDGRVKGLKADEVIARDGAGAVYPPEWPTAQYRVQLTREAGQWKIRSMTALK